MLEGIRAWLENLGLAKYGDSFVDNDIDTDVLAYLTEEHFKELGVSIGDRLRLLKAIGSSALEAREAPEPVTLEPKGPPPLAPEPSNDAERRPLTVMFCDLADSTELSTKLDPEDLQDVIRAYQETCTKLIQEYEGFVARYMGDGILVYFGYPKSLERNAERAVRSALSIVEAMIELNQTMKRDHDIEVAVRIGIATGMVMVGEVIGEGLAQERTVVGEAPNIAARLQSLAGRNGIVIGSLTKELTGDGFIYEDQGSKELKGIEGLVQTWGVAGLRDDAALEQDLDENGGGAAPTVLVGRDEEAGLLNRAWQSVKDEERGQVVSISGEAGIGKSVLVDGLRASVRAEGLSNVALRSSPYHTNSALYPVIEHLKRFAGWQSEDNAEMRLGKLEAALEIYDQPNEESVPLLAALMSLSLPEDRFPPLTMTSQQLKAQTQDAIIALMLEAAERQPLLQLWEDLHWADPSTLELIGLLIDQAPTASLLMVMTVRPEFIPPWPARSHTTPITLNRLERPHAEALVTQLADMKPLPDEVVEHIVSKADGVPLYVEELTRTILSSDILHDTGKRFELTGPISSLSIPDTLQESLMARLDRLPQVRELAQLGSVLGREFAYEMISGLSTTEDTLLQEGLGQLVDAELLYQRGRPPRARYIFKHALIQDAAYGSLLRRTRQKHHLQVAQLLESKFSDMVETNPELVAHHYSEAGESKLAVDYFEKSGKQSLRSSANQEAIAHLSKGLEVVTTIPDTNERAQRELNLLTTMGPALIALKGYASPDVEQVYRRALALCQGIGDAPKHFSALHGLWFVNSMKPDLDAAKSAAEQLVEMASGLHDSGLDLASKRALGYTLNYLGELQKSRSVLEQIIASYDPIDHSVYTFHHGGADLGVGSFGQIAWTIFALGYPDQAVEKCEQSLALSRQLAHPFSETWANVSAAIVYHFRGEEKKSGEHAEAALKIANEEGFVFWMSWASILRSWSVFQQGGGSETIVEMRSFIDAAQATGAGLLLPFWLSLLAKAYGQNDQADKGVAAVTEALEIVVRTNERFYEADLYRIKGQLLLQSDVGNESEAEASFHKAIEVAQFKEAKSWELRAATNLAILWRDNGKPKDAENLLKPIYEWFTEGFEIADLVKAKALLEELD